MNLDLKIKELKQLEEQILLREGLPHLFGFRLYQWQADFINTKNKNAFICSSNQVGKTFAQGIRLINLATCVDTWDQWWSHKPTNAWYLLPSKEMAEAVIDLKWRLDLLPRESFKDHRTYGWKINKAHGGINYVEFNSGFRIYIKSYSMGAAVLQSGSCDYVAFDEELPWDLYSELNARRMATDGYLSGVMTPTSGQEEWRRVFEVRGEKEIFPHAYKKQISIFDCQQFTDGTKSRWTEARIQEVIDSCSSDSEVQRRVYGRFVKSTGLLYPHFSIKNNVKPPHDINFSSGFIYTGVDPGAGKTTPGSHPTAICFVWVSPELDKARVFTSWLSPEGVETESRTILEQYQKMKGTKVCAGEYYDWKNKDFEIVARGAGYSFQRAEKGRDLGHQMINMLFKTGALIIYDNEENQPLIRELMSLGVDEKKTEASDDAIDAMRYAITSIPFNWELITDLKIEFDGDDKDKSNKIIDMRMNPPEDLFKIENDEIEGEIDFWNSHYEGK